MDTSPSTEARLEVSQELSFRNDEKEGLDFTPKRPSPVASASQEESEAPDSSPHIIAEARTVHGWKWAAAAASLYFGALIYGLDGTIAADIQSAIIQEFESVEKLTWIGTAFPLGSVCAILPGYARQHSSRDT
jgi:hypothetical protein